MLEVVARAGIGRGKPCDLVVTAFAVIIFLSDIVLLIIVCACLCRDLKLLLQSDSHLTGLNSVQ